MPSSRAIVVTEPGQIECRQVQVGDPNPGEVLVQVSYSAMSPGTERRVISGQQQAITGPTVIGYSAAGTVIKGDADGSWAVGDRVFISGSRRFADADRLWGGHAEFLIADSTALSRVPAEVSLLDASITKMAAIAHHGLHVSQAKPDDRVLVLGLGLIGQLSARLFANTCKQTLAADVDADRVALAAGANVEAVVIDKTLKPLTTNHENDFDIICDATGVPTVPAAALGLLKSRPWGDVVTAPPVYLLQGSYAGDLALPYTEAFMKEASFLLPRDEGLSDRQAVLEMLANGNLRVGDLTTHLFKPEDAIDAYAAVLDSGQGAPATAIFDWS
jgi:2-desacetyl-2-hydroxyethyl bacteriochlorophyllide A dehydrogenase